MKKDKSIESKYNVEDAIWLATALLSYEKYKTLENPTISDMCFMQSKILEKARTLTNKKVNMVRTSEHCCGDHKEHTYAYLRAIRSERRLSAPNEFGGYRTLPQNMNMNDFVLLNDERIQIKELWDFVHNEYKKLINDNISIQYIDCLGILKYLNEYAGKEYCSESKRTDANRKQMEKNEQAGKNATAKLEKIAKICEEYSGLRKYKSNDWLDGSGRKLRKYLWIQLKKPEKFDKPESISLFVEPSDIKKTSRFRISLEIHNRDAKKIPGETERYHRHLDLPLNQEKGLTYVQGSNETEDSLIIKEKNHKKIKENLEKYGKVQISRVIEWTENLTNERCVKMIKDAVNDLLPYYEYVVEDLTYKEVLIKMHTTSNVNEFDKNMILYGPPGTGKTYKTAIYAVAICDNKTIEELKVCSYEEIMERYRVLKKEKRIEFTTFHQSYGYEEFIEGIKPVMNSKEENNDGENGKEIKYEIQSGVFKKFCDVVKTVNISEELKVTNLNSSPAVWKVSLKNTGNNEVRKECMEKGHIRIGWEVYGEEIAYENQNEKRGKRELNSFISKMKIGDIVLSCYSASTIDAVGIIRGEPEWHDEYDEYKRVRKVDWLVKGLNYNILELNDNKLMTLPTIYKLNRISPDEALRIVKDTRKNKNEENNEDKKYVFIIDEINRGNISKIFGELITLIEPSKRLGKEESIPVKLPYSQKEFCVPDNIYIIGTMNTADRSISLMDTALRRRFKFIEMMPEPEEIKDIQIEDLDIAKMLETINKRIEILYDREHMIGHAVFLELKKDSTIEKLADIFEKSVIPLLQEYFYEDYAKIQLILGDKFIKKQTLEKMFKENPEGIDLPEEKYTIIKDNLKFIESYKSIYE